MTPQPTLDLDARLELLALPQWRKLLRHFELGEGFALIVILARNRSLARLCRDELDLWLLARNRPRLTCVPIETPDALANMAEHLLSIACPKGPIWVDGTGAREVFEQPWVRCAVKLNRARDAVSARFFTPLILVGEPWIRELLRDTAPDFWSVRTFTAEIATVNPTATTLPSKPAVYAAEATEFTIDPDLALRAIAEIRGKSGRESQLISLLLRAVDGLTSVGRSEQALSIAQEAVEMCKTAVNKHPESDDYRRGLSISYNKIGDLQRSLGEGDAAHQFYEKALTIRERLAAQEPGRADYLRDVSVSYERMGDLQQSLGEGEAARQFYEKALTIRERLAAQEPGRSDYLRDISVSYERMGDLQRSLGEGEAARQFYEKALTIRERLAAQEPGRSDYLRDVSISYGRMGDLQRSLGEGEAARQFYEKALAIAERLTAQEPGRADLQVDLAESLLKFNNTPALQRAIDILLHLDEHGKLSGSDKLLLSMAQGKRESSLLHSLGGSASLSR